MANISSLLTIIANGRYGKDIRSAIHDVLSNHETRISTNTSNISTNKTNIATNKTNIAANTSDIAANTSDIAINTKNISTLTSKVNTNTSNISDMQISLKSIESNGGTNNLQLGSANRYVMNIVTPATDAVTGTGTYITDSDTLYNIPYATDSSGNKYPVTPYSVTAEITLTGSATNRVVTGVTSVTGHWRGGSTAKNVPYTVTDISRTKAGSQSAPYITTVTLTLTAPSDYKTDVGAGSDTDLFWSSLTLTYTYIESEGTPETVTQQTVYFTK